MTARGWALLGMLALPGAAAAQQFPVACDDCASCTTALAADGALAELRGDLDASGVAACVRITGRGATLDGHRHAVRGAAVGVEVAAEDVVVRNVRAEGGGVGFRVAGARAVTLLNAAVSDARVGVRIEGSRDVRVLRAALSGNRVGVSMGADGAGRCAAAAPLASTGVVIARSRVEGGGVGVAACDAMPVLTGNTVTGNGQGVLLGPVVAQGAGPGGGPWDACSCAPAPRGVAPGTLLLYSSGCGGCTVHESWLAGERSRGAVIRARAGGADGGPEQARFDAYLRHCGPELVDALGIPGCVPNYACPATSEVWKRREGDRGLAVDRAVGSPDDVVAFSEACRAAARQGYGRGGRCVAASLRSNTLCGNRGRDLTVAGPLARWGSAGDRCGSVEADGAAGRCAQTCEGVDAGAAPSPAVATPAPSRSTTPSIGEEPADAGAVGAAPVPRAPAAPVPRAWWLAAGAAALGVGLWRPWAKRRP